MARGGSVVWYLIYIIFGVYFINSSLVYIIVPEVVLNYDKWITLVGGILILVGGINHFRASSLKRRMSK